METLTEEQLGCCYMENITESSGDCGMVRGVYRTSRQASRSYRDNGAGRAHRLFGRRSSLQRVSASRDIGFHTTIDVSSRVWVPTKMCDSGL